MANRTQAQKIKDLKSDVEYLRKELEEVRADREKLRNHFIARFKWWIKLLGEQSTPNMAWLIENDSQWLRKFKIWSW